MTMSEFFGATFAESLKAIETEILFAVFFAIPFLAFVRLRGGAPKSKKKERMHVVHGGVHHAEIQKKYAEFNMEGVVKHWRDAIISGPTPLGTFPAVVRALHAVEPERVISEVVEHMQAYAFELGNVKAANVVLKAVSQCDGGFPMMAPLWDALTRSFRVQRDTQTTEIWMSACANAGDEAGVSALVAQVKEGGEEISAGCYSAIIHGFQAQGRIDAAMKYVLAMAACDYNVPAVAVNEIFRLACRDGRVREVVERFRRAVQLSTDAVALVCEDCLRRSDVRLAHVIEEIAKESETPLNIKAYDSLLKIYAEAGDPRASGCLREMLESGRRVSEGLLVALVSRCAAPRFRQFAEEVFRHARANGKASLSMHSALMKVYEHDGLYAEACSVYDLIVSEGLEPDSVLHGCIIKYASKCGRDDLLASIGQQFPAWRVHHFNSLIRACGHSKDVEKAFSLFQQLQATGLDFDVKVWNNLLDVCVKAGALDRARRVVSEMQAGGLADEVTFNVLLKGYCAKGDSRKAALVLEEMTAAGCKPCSTAYNCLINMFVCSGSVQQAWNTIATMEKNKIPVDTYTLSTMMKSVKTSVAPAQDLKRVLALLDRSGVDACKDDVMLVSLLEACIKQLDLQRLQKILQTFEVSETMNCANMPAYGLVIKAYGLLRQVEGCRKVWRSILARGLQPTNIVTGCMLHALVCNDCVDEAVEIVDSDRARGIKPNAIMCSTLIKGFFIQRKAEPAFELLQEMRAGWMKINLATYNHVTSLLTCAGAMEKVRMVESWMQSDGMMAKQR